MAKELTSADRVRIARHFDMIGVACMALAGEIRDGSGLEDDTLDALVDEVASAVTTMNEIAKHPTVTH